MININFVPIYQNKFFNLSSIWLKTKKIKYELLPDWLMKVNVKFIFEASFYTKFHLFIMDFWVMHLSGQDCNFVHFINIRIN